VGRHSKHQERKGTQPGNPRREPKKQKHQGGVPEVPAACDEFGRKSPGAVGIKNALVEQVRQERADGYPEKLVEAEVSLPSGKGPGQLRAHSDMSEKKHGQYRLSDGFLGVCPGTLMLNPDAS
jgi:hypothetical protein